MASLWCVFFFSSRRRHTRCSRDWSSDVCSSDLSGLLRDLPLLEQIFCAVRRAVKIPLTIKLRAGWDEKSIVAVEVARLAESIGVEAVAVHPRTRMQGYAGRRSEERRVGKECRSRWS